MRPKKYFLVISFMIALSACQPQPQEKDSTESPSIAQQTRYLYVATGACYSGTGNTTYAAATASNIIFKVNLQTGVYEGRVADFTKATEASGTTPVSIADYDSTRMMVLLEHSGQRRIELIEKKISGERQSFYSNTSATAPIGILQSVAKYLITVPDGFLVSRTTAIEKMDLGKNRRTG
ncbi:MAG TPA: hypothetical protein VGE46_08210, partial [Bdellovibrio sp.]